MHHCEKFSVIADGEKWFVSGSFKVYDNSLWRKIIYIYRCIFDLHYVDPAAECRAVYAGRPVRPTQRYQ